MIGYKDLPHAIDYRVTITIPGEEHNKRCDIEAITGYMPPDFKQFWAFDESTGKLEPLDEGPAEQAHPVVFSTADGTHAMGVFAPAAAARHGQTGPTYGRWNFKPEQVVKWNCVYRVTDPDGLGGEYAYRVFVAVGSMEDVRSTLIALVAEFKK